MDKLSYIEFSDPRLVALYDTLNPFSEDTHFYLELAKKLNAQKIIDIGCGTGLLTCEFAKQGISVIGVEPEAAMLEVARKRPYGDKVEWIEGDATNLLEVEADLAIMTGHVAQVFLEDTAWEETLAATYKSLRTGGYIAFESRNPLLTPWKAWNLEKSRREAIDPVLGKVSTWSNLLEMNGRSARYEMHYLFENSNEELISETALSFRSEDEIKDTLAEVGFSIQDIYGTWDGEPFDSAHKEMIFVASKS